MDEELWKTAKRAAIKEGTALQDLLNDAVKEWIRKNQESRSDLL
jgi:hypothetical protein